MSEVYNLSSFIDLEVIDNIRNLVKFVKYVLTNAKIIAIDVESDRNHRYGHNLSLIQIGTLIEDKPHQYNIDPLAFTQKEDEKNFKIEFSRVLESNILKLFYAGNEDIQVLKRDFNGKIRNVYDIQMANGLVNGSLNIMVGLDKLINKEFQIEIPRHLNKLQRTDWSIRPLTKNMLEYASVDVAFLIQLYHKFEKILRKHKNYALYLRFFNSLELIEPVNEELAELVRFMKMYDYDSLSKLDKLLVYRLHLFRTDKAKQINRPSHFILSKKDFKGILEMKPKTIKEYERLNIMKFKKNTKFKNNVIEVINNSIDDYNKNENIFEEEVKPIEDLVFKLGRKDLYLVNFNDMSLNLNVELETYKERKYLITKWRNEKADELKIHKELFLSSQVINLLSNYKNKENKLSVLPGMDIKFINEYNEEIITILNNQD